MLDSEWKFKIKAIKELETLNLVENVFRKITKRNENLPEFESNDKYLIEKVEWNTVGDEDEIILNGYVIKNDSKFVNFLLNDKKYKEFCINMERTVEDRIEKIECSRIRLLFFELSNHNTEGFGRIYFHFKVDNLNRISNGVEIPRINVRRTVI